MHGLQGLHLAAAQGLHGLHLAAQGLHFFAPHWAIWTGSAAGFAFAAGNGVIVDIAATVTITAPAPAIAGSFDDANN